MSYHHNEKDQWLRYGAAMYLRNCSHAVIKKCRVTGGQNALMMMECDNGKIFNNDFSFNSGFGVWIYKSNNNEMAYKRIMSNGVKYQQFFTIAEGRANFPKGAYGLSLTWDDAIQVYVDDKMLIDEWVPSKYLFDESPNKKIRVDLNGNHRFRVEHVELGSFATLGLKLKPVE